MYKELSVKYTRLGI